MARLDVFVCDKCGKRVTAGNNGASVSDWVRVHFSFEAGPAHEGNSLTLRELLVCPSCNSSIHDPYPQLSSK